MSDPEDYNRQTVTVKVDNHIIEQKNAELEAKIKEYEQKEKDAKAAQEAQKLADEEKAKEEQEAEKPLKKIRGSVGIPSTPSRKGYNSYEEMINDLRVRESCPSTREEAKEITDTLYAKILAESRSGIPLNLSGQFNPENKSLAEMFNENYRARRKLSGVD